jgi:hypothetical protein
MPEFFVEEDPINITPDEFVDSCNRKEIKELINLVYEKQISKVCASEKIFIDHLKVLMDKWNSLSKEEEETIIKIANRFV